MKLKGKKKGKKKKKKGPPPHDKGWDKAVSYGVWERPLEALPDPAIHSSLKEIRDNILSTAEKLSMHWSEYAKMNDFVKELFGICRPKLVTLELRGARFLTQIVLSPVTIAQGLRILDLSCCEALEYVFLQCATLETVLLNRCDLLRKAILHTKKLKDANLLQCGKLSVLIVWSDALSSLRLPPDLTPARFKTLQLHCPNFTVDRAIQSVESNPAHSSESTMSRTSISPNNQTKEEPPNEKN